MTYRVFCFVLIFFFFAKRLFGWIKELIQKFTVLLITTHNVHEIREMIARYSVVKDKNASMFFPTKITKNKNKLNLNVQGKNSKVYLLLRGAILLLYVVWKISWYESTKIILYIYSRNYRLPFFVCLWTLPRGKETFLCIFTVRIVNILEQDVCII